MWHPDIIKIWVMCGTTDARKFVDNETSLSNEAIVYFPIMLPVSVDTNYEMSAFGSLHVSVIPIGVGETNSLDGVAGILARPFYCHHKHEV